MTTKRVSFFLLRTGADLLDLVLLESVFLAAIKPPIIVAPEFTGYYLGAAVILKSTVS
jgi:hypothetical protein